MRFKIAVDDKQIFKALKQELDKGPDPSTPGIFIAKKGENTFLIQEVMDRFGAARGANALISTGETDLCATLSSPDSGIVVIHSKADELAKEGGVNTLMNNLEKELDIKPCEEESKEAETPAEQSKPQGSSATFATHAMEGKKGLPKNVGVGPSPYSPDSGL